MALWAGEQRVERTSSCRLEGVQQNHSVRGRFLWHAVCISITDSRLPPNLVAFRYDTTIPGITLTADWILMDRPRLRHSRYGGGGVQPLNGQFFEGSWLYSPGPLECKFAFLGVQESDRPRDPPLRTRGTGNDWRDGTQFAWYILGLQ